MEFKVYIFADLGTSGIRRGHGMSWKVLENE